MDITVHHHNNGQPHTYFCRGHHHDKENKQLPVGTRYGRGIIGQYSSIQVHFGKGHQQQVYGIQHNLNRHEYNNGVSSVQHSKNSDTEKEY